MSKTYRSLRKLKVNVVSRLAYQSPFVLLSCKIMSKFERCRFVLFLMVEPVHQISERLSNFYQTHNIYMNCIQSFRDFFFRKKTFSLIWEKIKFVGNSLAIFTWLTTESFLLFQPRLLTVDCLVTVHLHNHIWFTTNFWKWILAFLWRWQSCNYGHKGSSSWQHKPIPAFKSVDLTTVP